MDKWISRLHRIVISQVNQYQPKDWSKWDRENKLDIKGPPTQLTGRKGSNLKNTAVLLTVIVTEILEKQTDNWHLGSSDKRLEPNKVKILIKKNRKPI